MLIKKQYNTKNMIRRNDLYDGGKLNTSFFIAPDLFIVCSCEFWITSDNKTLVIIVKIEAKEMSCGFEIKRKLKDAEKHNLIDILKCLFRGIPPETKLIQVYE